MLKLLVKTMWCMLNTFFSSKNVEFWYVLDRECLCDQPLINPESLMSFPGRQHFTHDAITHCWGN